MCKALGIPEISDREVRSLIGPPIQEALAKKFHFEGAEADVAVKVHREYYGSRGIHEFTKYPGTDELLEDLKELGFSLYITTSKPTVYAREMVTNAGWAGRFAGISGAELDGSVGHKADVIEQVLQGMQRDEAAVVLVGDRAEDVYGARSNGIPCIGVDWGFGSAEELLSAGASIVVSSCEELLETLSPMC